MTNLMEPEQCLDIMTAHLRSRYYYARFMIYRPCVYKVLHYPQLVTPEEKHMVALCLQASLLWPITMAPPRDRKRLLPNIYAWSQNFFAVLLIFRMMPENKLLRDIVQQQLDAAELQQTLVLLLDWIRDMKQVCCLSQWSWPIVNTLFHELIEEQEH